ncbi:MAG: GlsB/YeaQ/YmgE family stress response membrane protein [Gammaproteobacteria bacterium]|nr:MAG: GlsB/YeaQ/YmgE family stress response membrane protein [Gammaproteobacteria bacterium]
MRIESLLAFLVVGGVAGWLAGQVVRGRGFGLPANLVVGVLGAFIAGWLLPKLGVSVGGGLLGDVIQAMIGAIFLLVVITLVRKR